MKTAPAFLVFLVFICMIFGSLTGCTQIQRPPEPAAEFEALCSAGDGFTGRCSLSLQGASEIEVISPDTLKGMKVRDLGGEILVSVGRTEKSSLEFPRFNKMTPAQVLRCYRDAFSGGFMFKGRKSSRDESTGDCIFESQGNLGNYTLLTDSEGIPKEFKTDMLTVVFSDVVLREGESSQGEDAQDEGTGKEQPAAGSESP